MEEDFRATKHFCDKHISLSGQYYILIQFWDLDGHSTWKGNQEIFLFYLDFHLDTYLSLSIHKLATDVAQ